MLKKKRGLILALQVLLVIGFGVSIFTLVQSEIEPTQVYVFNKDLPVNSKITMNDVTAITVTKDTVAKGKGIITNEKDLEDKYVTIKASEGEYVTENITEVKKNLDPFKNMDLSKYRKISLPINFIDGVSGNMKKGDKVDLIYVGNGEKDNGEFNYSKDFLQDVLIWNVNTEDGFKFIDHSELAKGEIPGGKQEGEKIDTASAGDSVAVITLAVTADQAEEILARAKSGEVKVLGRFDGSQNYSTLGYVLGDFNKVFTGDANAETSSPVVAPN